MIAEVRVAGGGSQSGTTMPLNSNIFGLPIAGLHVFEALVLGAAIDTAVELKFQGRSVYRPYMR